MAKQKNFTREFETEAVCLAQTSGRTQREIGEDLGVGLSMLVRRIGRGSDQAMDQPTGSAATEDMAAELKRLRRENEILLASNARYRSVPRLFSPRVMWKRKHSRKLFSHRTFDDLPFQRPGEEEFAAHRLCKVPGVSQSGYFAWKDRPASHRQR